MASMGPEQVLARPEAVDPPCPSERRELQAILDEEIGRLPEKYRTPLVLCYFEGKSHDQAARELGWAKRSLTNRVCRGRELLRRQLVRRGLIAVANRADANHKEVAYGTTARFLELFDLRSLEDLPQTQDLQKL